MDRDILVHIIMHNLRRLLQQLNWSLNNIVAYILERRETERGGGGRKRDWRRRERGWGGGGGHRERENRQTDGRMEESNNNITAFSIVYVQQLNSITEYWFWARFDQSVSVSRNIAQYVGRKRHYRDTLRSTRVPSVMMDKIPNDRVPKAAIKPPSPTGEWEEHSFLFIKKKKKKPAGRTIFLWGASLGLYDCRRDRHWHWHI